MKNLAIIGLGVMGKNHYRVLNSIPNIKIKALCDVNIKGDYPEKTYNNVDEMLNNEEIDAAIISTPTFLHKEIALKCINKGVSLLIEKPVASNLKDGYEILEAAEKNDVKIAVGHVERFNPVVNSLKNELIGKEIYNISITRVGPIPPRIGDVGVLTDLSVHDIDLIRFLTGSEIKDKNIYKLKKIYNHYEDNAILSFKLENDTIADIITNWLTPFKKRTIEVACKEAFYEADLISQELKEYSSYSINNSYLVRDCFVKKGEPLLNELTAFSSFLRDNIRGNLAAIQDSVKTLEILN